MRCSHTCVITGRSPHLVESHPVVTVLLRCFLCVTCTSRHGGELTNISPALLTGRQHFEELQAFQPLLSDSPLMFHSTHIKNIELFHTLLFVMANSKFYAACAQRSKAQTLKKNIHSYGQKNVLLTSVVETGPEEKKYTLEQTTCAPAPFSTTITNEAHGKKKKNLERLQVSECS